MPDAGSYLSFLEMQARYSEPLDMAAGPYLSWLSLAFFDRIRGLVLSPLPLEFGRYRCRTGLVSRRSAEDLPPFRLLKKTVRDVALGRSG